jgi:hypothetical protein
MKRMFTILLLFGLAGFIQAQTLVFTTESVREWGDPGDVKYFNCDLENAWNQSNNVAIRMEPHLPSGWNVGLCTKLGCLPPGVLYMEYVLDALEIDTAVTVDIYSGSVQDSGWVVTYAMSLVDTNVYRDTVTNTFITYPNGIMVHTAPGIPEQFRLAQNYPNPFNPSTTISISIPENLVGQDAGLYVYDILGRQVRQLYRGRLSSGTLRVLWDGRNTDFTDVPSGTYFCRFAAGQMEVVRSMQLIR